MFENYEDLKSLGLPIYSPSSVSSHHCPLRSWLDATEERLNPFSAGARDSSDKAALGHCVHHAIAIAATRKPTKRKPKPAWKAALEARALFAAGEWIDSHTGEKTKALEYEKD